MLASNVANVDTPGFRPLEVVRNDVEEPQASAPMAATHTAHYANESALFLAESGEQPMSILEDHTASPGADGNAVTLEREMAKLAANDLRYEGAAKIVSAQLAGLRYAANDFMSG